MRTVVISGEHNVIKTYFHHADGTTQPLTVERMAWERHNNHVQFAFAYHEPNAATAPDIDPLALRQVLDQMWRV